jgi:hypothetical protein
MKLVRNSLVGLFVVVAAAVVVAFMLPRGDGTTNVWDFRTDLGNNPVARHFGLMFDKWIGADYENGLARLKVLVGSQP